MAHARSEKPAECCGILVGRRFEILEATRTRNVADRPDRFIVDPKGHIEARRDARNRGLEVVGFYHSHPHAEALPSSIDLANALYPDALHLIVSLVTEQTKIRLFRHEPSGFVEVEFTCM